jgi:glycosyltransferase involved in cell wall biosynthesis
MNSVKEIIVFNKDISAGISTILKNIIQFKPESEIQYKLILYHFDQPQHNLVQENWCNDVNRIRLSSCNNLYTTIKQLRKFISGQSVLVANDITELRMAALLKLKNPLIYIIHGDFETYYKQCEIFQDYMDLIIAYSSHIVQKLNQRLKPQNTHKIKLIYYPVPEINSSETVNENKPLNIVFAGSLIKRKGVDLLPEIIAKLDKAEINYKLTIAGSGPMREWLSTKTENNPKVILTGQKSNTEIIKLFSKSDILLFPTRSEGLPNVLVEAMKEGCIPIVSNIESGIPDVVENCKDGYLIEPEKTESFANAIINLYNNPTLLESIKEAAIKKAHDMFNPKFNAKAYFNAFVSTPFKEQTPTININRGPMLNKPYLPNLLVKCIRKLKISPHL